MKRWICLILVLCTVLSLFGCGATAPVETVTEGMDVAEAPTEMPTEQPTEAPTEPVITYTEYTLGEYETYEEVVLSMGFGEAAPGLYQTHEAFFNRTALCEATGLSLTENGFRMELYTEGLCGMSRQPEQTSDWVLYGAKADGLANISGLRKDDTYKYYTERNQKSDWPEDGHCQFTEYSFYTTKDGNINKLGYIYAVYYPETGNLYNLVREYTGLRTKNTTSGRPWIFIETDWEEIPYQMDVYTLQHGEYELSMSKFAILWGHQWNIYEYRPGMSLMSWACSEMNTDGWIPWYDNSVLSPDGKYIVSWADRPIEEIAAGGTTITTYVYDGFPDWYWSIGFELEDGTVLPNIEASSQEERRQNLETYLADWGATEEEAKTSYGNKLIPSTMAYMVNAYTPLVTEGFRIMSKMDGRVWYHMVEINDFYIVDDVIDVYMNNISDDVLSHIKMYAFPEPQEMLDALDGKSIMDVDQQALHLGADWLKIPENAVCIEFQRCRDGRDAANSPFPYPPAHGQNPNYNAVYARYKVAEDPNFDPDAGILNPHYVDQEMALAITYDDEIVYWIHLGSNAFHKQTSDFIRHVNAARY